MSCTKYTLKGIGKGCKDSLGGIVTCWVSTDTNLYAADASLDLTNYDVPQFDTSVINSSYWNRFDFFKNTGSMTTTANISESSGTSFSTELALQFMKKDTDKRLQMMSLCLSEVIAVVKDSNGKYWLLGWDEPLACSALTGQTGQNATDLNGYNITLKDDSTEMPHELTDSAAITAFNNISAPVSPTN